MATDRAARLAVLAAAALLLWPALWNGYPIVFADTGTYLSQAIRLYAGWDRPVFYSVFMLPLHWTITVWPVIVVQALLAAWVLRLVCRALAPGISPLTFVASVGALSVCTWLPWLVCELMPDLFTPLLVLALCLLALTPDRLSRTERLALAALATFMIATQQSSLPLTAGVLVVLTLTAMAEGVLTARTGNAPTVAADRAALSVMAGRVPAIRASSDGAKMAGTRPAMTDKPQPTTTNASLSVSWPQPSALVSWPGLARPPTTSPAPTRKDLATRPYQIVAADYPAPSVMAGSVSAIRAWSAGAKMAGTRPATTDKPHPTRLRRWPLLILPPLLALLALCSVNLAAHGRFAVSPFGNIFLLARVLYDGPGMAALHRDCPTTHWRLCPFLADFPTNSDDFLWTQDSPLNRAGGPKLVSTEADAMIAAAIRADPVGELRAALTNTLTQLTQFASGDGLTPWPAQVTPWIDRYFPAREQAAYATARQQRGTLTVPSLLARIHQITALTGIIACVLLLPGAIRRRSPCAGFLLAILLVLPLSAAITGALSGPHDRYQARIMWLPPFAAAIAFAATRRQPP